MTASPDLSPARRARELEALASGDGVDLVVIGGGITGCGVALDAASRGLSVALLEREDLAHGTSRFSSKLVHGGLRYLAQGQVGVAAESARERHHLMTTIAPHLISSLPGVMPFDRDVSRTQRATLRVGLGLGDGLRRAAGTRAGVLARSRRIGAGEAVSMVPGLRQAGLDGALLGFDGRLEDDARLVVAVARTAATHGARIITRCAAQHVERGRVHALDRRDGVEFTIDVARVINATGVWAGELTDGVDVVPSKGSHVIVPAERLGSPTAQLTVPAREGGAKYVFAIPTADNTVIIGLTDTEFDGPIPDQAVAEEWEIDLLLGTISAALETTLERADVIGSFAGLRPLLRPPGEHSGRTADVSREHQVIEDAVSGMHTIVGGKLTTYRKMAQDAVDKISDRRCTTTRIPLVGAVGEIDPQLPERLRRRLGAEAGRAAALAGGDPALLSPLADGSSICAAELRFAAAYELAMTDEDLLERRTRAGLTPALAEALAPAASEALAWAQESQTNNPEGAADGHAATPN